MSRLETVVALQFFLVTLLVCSLYSARVVKARYQDFLVSNSLHELKLHCITLHYTTTQYITVNYVTLQCITVNHSKQANIKLYYSAEQQIALAAIIHNYVLCSFLAYVVTWASIEGCKAVLYSTLVSRIQQSLSKPIFI